METSEIALITLLLVQTANLKSSQAREIASKFKIGGGFFVVYLKIGKIKIAAASPSYEI